MAEIGLRVPKDVIEAKCQRYMRKAEGNTPSRTRAGKRLHNHHDVPTRISGIANYYRLAYNLHTLNKLNGSWKPRLTRHWHTNSECQ